MKQVEPLSVKAGGCRELLPCIAYQARRIADGVRHISAPQRQVAEQRQKRLKSSRRCCRSQQILDPVQDLQVYTSGQKAPFGNAAEAPRLRDIASVVDTKVSTHDVPCCRHGLTTS